MSQDRQGWFADPFRLHEQRYFSAGRPTELVRDGTVEAYDEPPAEMLEPAATAFWSADGTTDQPAAPESSQYRGSRPRRRGPGFTTWYLATVVVVAAIVAVVIVAVRHRTPAPRGVPASATEVAFVSQSAQRTLTERTAHDTISGSVQVDGHTITITGAGEIDFSTGAEAQTLQMSVDAQHLVAEKTIMVGGHLYYTVLINGSDVVGQLSAADWLEAPVPLPSSANLTSRDPRAALLLLEHSGTVRALGTKSLGGVTCTGYAVTPSRQAMAAAVNKELLTLKISESQAGLARSMAPPTITVWVDAHGFLRQMSVDAQIGALASGTGSGTATMTLSNYGAAVHISPPPSRDVIPLKTFLRMLANDNGSKSVPWTATTS